ncbi:MAG: MerR family transcriptional regulator [Bacteroidetes bacterium]|nr:MerR family transcriptional regulator [Bacteroidota bacterium]
MPYKEKEIQKLYYSIGEVAEMFEVSTSLIRFWENEFDVLKPKKNKKGNRQFTQNDITNLKLIFHLVKEKGYTLEGAKKKIRENKDDSVDNMELIDSLTKIRKFLIDMKEKL